MGDEAPFFKLTVLRPHFILWVENLKDLFALDQHGCSGISFDLQHASIPHLGQVIVTICIAVKKSVTMRAKVGRFRSALLFYGIAALHQICILAVRPFDLLGTGTASQYNQEHQEQVFHVSLLS